MPIRDEKVFSDEEMIAAFEIILPPEQAREEGVAFNSLPDLHFEDPTPEEFAGVQGLGPRSYNHDFWTCSRSFRTAVPSAHGGSWACPPGKESAAATHSGAASRRRGPRGVESS